jgi:hypothetical protein
MLAPMLTALAHKHHLELLLLERTAAVGAGLDADAAYMADLESELAATRAAWIGSAVTEIATFRAQLGGPLKG